MDDATRDLLTQLNQEARERIQRTLTELMARGTTWRDEEDDQ